MNTRQNKAWKKDFDEWQNKKVNFPTHIHIKQYDNGTIQSISNTSELKTYIGTQTNRSNALLKTYLGIIKTFTIIQEMDEDDIEEYIYQLEDKIINSFTEKQRENSVIKDFFNRYFNYKGNNFTNIFENYNPTIPEKNKMCAFTGGIGSKEYKEDVAFSMKARGFSNRTITTLNNTASHISDLFAEENKLRKSQSHFPKDANVIIYNDFFETTLDIDRDILKACTKAKNIKILKDTFIQFDKSAKFQYNLYNINFDTIKPGIEANFYYVRKCLLLVKSLGIRSYITGVMSPYQPHKEAFRYENAPKFLRQLGWDKVRLTDIDRVLEEISLILTLGKSRLESNLLRISDNRNKYFIYTIYLKKRIKKGLRKAEKFIKTI